MSFEVKSARKRARAPGASVVSEKRGSGLSAGFLYIAPGSVWGIPPVPSTLILAPLAAGPAFCSHCLSCLGTAWSGPSGEYLGLRRC